MTAGAKVWDGAQWVPAVAHPTLPDLAVADGAEAAWVMDSATTVDDITGNGHAGAVTGATLTGAGGPGDLPFLSFAGAGHVLVPYWSALNSTTGPFTAEIVWRTGTAPSAPPNQGVLMARDASVSDTWSMDVRPTQAASGFFYTGSQYREFIAANHSWSLNTWNIMHFVKTAGSAFATLLLNGRILGATPTGIVASNTTAGLILAGFTPTTRRFTGDIAFAAWYPSALSLLQVQAHHVAFALAALS